MTVRVAEGEVLRMKRVRSVCRGTGAPTKVLAIVHLRSAALRSSGTANWSTNTYLLQVARKCCRTMLLSRHRGLLSLFLSFSLSLSLISLISLSLSLSFSLLFESELYLTRCRTPPTPPPTHTSKFHMHGTAVTMQIVD